MTDKVKTPEELVEVFADSWAGIYSLVCKERPLTDYDLKEAFLAGYEAAKAEFLDEHYAIFYVDGVKYKVEKMRIVHSISNIQRIETKED